MPESAPSQGSSQEEAHGEAGPEASPQTGDSQLVANQKSLGETLSKALKVISTLNDRIEKLEKSLVKTRKRSKETQELQKSLTLDQEVLKKSFHRHIDELNKTHKTQLEELRKSYGSELEELKKSLNKPARTRESVSHFQVLQKGNSEEQSRKLYKSKAEVIEKLEELKKSGKISGDEIISYNVSNILSEKTRKLLSE